MNFQLFFKKKNLLKLAKKQYPKSVMPVEAVDFTKTKPQTPVPFLTVKHKIKLQFC